MKQITLRLIALTSKGISRVQLPLSSCVGFLLLFIFILLLLGTTFSFSNWKIQCNPCTGLFPSLCPWRSSACHSWAPEVLGLWVRIQICHFSPASHQFDALFCLKQCEKQNSIIVPFFKICFLLLQWWLWSVVIRCKLRAVTVTVLPTWEILGSVSYSWRRELCSAGLIANGTGKTQAWRLRQVCDPAHLWNMMGDIPILECF